VYALTNAGNDGFASIGTLLPLAVSILILIGFVAIESRSKAPLMQWQLDVSAVRIADGRTTLRLHWTRTRKGAAGVERDETNEFTLGPDDSHVLDFVENADPSSNCASLLLRTSAQPIVPANARPVVVDLWTVD
jgi:hypothetical protein